MNHPDSAQWMSYLYGELPRSERSFLRDHLQQCPDCRTQLKQWQGTVSCLAKWRISGTDSAVKVTFAQPALKWALAALLVLSLGGVLGRATAPHADAEAIRASVERSLRASLAGEVRNQLESQWSADWEAALSPNPDELTTPLRRQLRSNLDRWTARTAAASSAESERLLAEFAETYGRGRQEDRRAFLALLERAEQKRAAEYIALRRAVETVAVATDNKFQQTATELGQIASYAQAHLITESSNEPFIPEK